MGNLDLPPINNLVPTTTVQGSNQSFRSKMNLPPLPPKISGITPSLDPSQKKIGAIQAFLTRYGVIGKEEMELRQNHLGRKLGKLSGNKNRNNSSLSTEEYLLVPSGDRTNNNLLLRYQISSTIKEITLVYSDPISRTSRTVEAFTGTRDMMQKAWDLGRGFGVAEPKVGKIFILKLSPASALLELPDKYLAELASSDLSTKQILHRIGQGFITPKEIFGAEQLPEAWADLFK